jgi:hypothetical protein
MENIKKALADFYTLSTVIGFVSSKEKHIICSFCAEDCDIAEHEALYDNKDGITCDDCGWILGANEEDSEDYYYTHCELCMRFGNDSCATQTRNMINEHDRSFSQRPVCDSCAEALDSDRVCTADCLTCGAEIPYRLLSVNSRHHDKSCEHYDAEKGE